MQKTPKYYRARIAVIEELITKVDADGNGINNARVVLRNGVFPKGYDEEKLITEMLSKRSFSNETLSFQEQTRFNTWFAMHLEKVAGKEIVSTSREFPITIKGTKQDIINAISIDKGMQFQLSLKRKRAKAKLKIMQL